MNIANVAPRKTGDIFPSVTRVLRILLTTAATTAIVETMNCKELRYQLVLGNQKFLVRSRLPAMSRDELSAAMTRLISKCL